MPLGDLFKKQTSITEASKNIQEYQQKISSPKLVNPALVKPEVLTKVNPTSDEDKKRYAKKSEILKEYNMIESDIPVNHIYWKL